MSSENLVAVGAALVAASSSFILGQKAQNAEICKNLTNLIESDAYALFLKEKLYEVFKSCPPDETKPLNRMMKIMMYGFPGLDNIRVLSDHVLSYDRRNRVAHWVLEHLTLPCISNQTGVNRRIAIFRSDIAIPTMFRSTNQDYYRSGFDRGHLAAAANHKCDQQHMNDTFILSNIAPQVGVGFNRDAWNNLEMYTRNLLDTYPEIYICTGSMYEPKYKNSNLCVEYNFIGTSVVAVPTHFFKILLCITRDKKFILEAYAMPNQYIDNNIDLKTFRRPPEAIEKITGLQFFDKIKRSQYESINGSQVNHTEEPEETTAPDP
ncbi:endonuclease G, mitochondrial-like [Episyrphus balteatus]|uniref:endonuclease G, mitochondrial-like n=1 Tax=Episyrphus balteatus TaxID=286459 RepID=UPI00248601DF|nr:endonuclease G, mitochondrial-like [Episyrphus balteatus]